MWTASTPDHMGIQLHGTRRASRLSGSRAWCVCNLLLNLSAKYCSRGLLQMDVVKNLQLAAPIIS